MATPAGHIPEGSAAERPTPSVPGQSGAHRAPRRDEGAERPSRAQLRKRLIARSIGVALLLLAPGVTIFALDFGHRHDQIVHFTRKETALYVWWAFCGAALWGGLVYLSMARRTWLKWWGRLLLVAGAALAVGGQAYIFSRYGAYLDHRAALVGTSMMPSVGQQLWMDRWGFARALLPPLAFACAVPFVGRFLARARRSDAFFALDLSTFAIVVSLFGNVGDDEAAPPDVLYLSAMGQLTRAHWDHNETVERIHPGPRTPIPVPPLVAHQAAPRNVLFVITESVRAQSVCVAYDPKCKWTPFSNALLPDRLALTQMRALDSTTAISLAIMWGGLAPTSPRAALHSAPLLWEYAKAAGFHTAYWTSQNLLFGNSGTWIASVPLDRTVNATQIERDATMEIGADDGKLVDYVIDDMGQVPEPFMAVVHLSNTHFPYKIDPRYSPFEPEDEATGPGYENEIKNRYQDSIYLQDMAVAKLVRAVRARPEGQRTVIVFVSDHGEQMREKGAVGHTGTLWDEEIRIPAWIDAPPGTLTASERDHLRTLEATPLTNLDMLPTMLDLMGVYDAPELKNLEAPMPGRSLLRGGSTPHPIVMSNCTELWACAFRNWGAIDGTRKLLAHQYDHQWGCYDVATDPTEQDDLGEQACTDLIPLAEGNGRGRPF
ncbi:MAG TPA: sulfatase-like hydrolase/transferase [Polyangiaceae bacterium]|nr:sulfatase-like hydrolase/transferase [Polyangiaceae bacterium]